MFDAVTLSKYGGVFLALLLSGFGAPIPEEIPVVTAGAMVGHDAQDVADYNRRDDAADEFDDRAAAYAALIGGSAEYARPVRPDPPSNLTRWWIMLLVCIVGVVLGDSVIYTAGRVWGARLLKSQWVQRRILPPEKQAKIEANFHKNGILILLGARFTPGIRTPVFVMAGVLRMPLSRFILADALYAIPGVNLLFWLSYWFTDQFVAAIHAVERHRPMAVAVVLAAVGGVVLYKVLAHRKLSTGDVAEIPTYVKPVGAVTHAVEQTIEKAVGKTVQTAAKVVDKVTHPLGHAHATAAVGAGGLPAPVPAEVAAEAETPPAAPSSNGEPAAAPDRIPEPG